METLTTEDRAKNVSEENKPNIKHFELMVWFFINVKPKMLLCLVCFDWSALIPTCFLATNYGLSAFCNLVFRSGEFFKFEHIIPRLYLIQGTDLTEEEK